MVIVRSCSSKEPPKATPNEKGMIHTETKMDPYVRTQILPKRAGGSPQAGACAYINTALH